MELKESVICSVLNSFFLQYSNCKERNSLSWVRKPSKIECGYEQNISSTYYFKNAIFLPHLHSLSQFFYSFQQLGSVKLENGWLTTQSSSVRGETVMTTTTMTLCPPSWKAMMPMTSTRRRRMTRGILPSLGRACPSWKAVTPMTSLRRRRTTRGILRSLGRACPGSRRISSVNFFGKTVPYKFRELLICLF